MTTDLRKTKGQETRQKILTSALELLADEGESGFSAAKLAKRVGISKSSLFHHFPKVDEIPYAAVQSMVEQFSTAFKSHRFKTISGYLNALGDALSSVAEEQRKLSVVFLSYYIMAVREERYRKIQEQIIHSFLQQIEGDLEAILGRKMTRSERDTLPVIASMAYEGFGLYFNVLEDKTRLKKSWRVFSKMVEGYLS